MTEVSGGKQSHCQILEALHNGDLDAAVKLLRSHMSFYEKFGEEWVKDHGGLKGKGEP